MRTNSLLFLSDELEGKRKEIGKAIREENLPDDYYVCYLTGQPDALLSIMRVFFFRQESNSEKDELIIGIAEDYTAAEKLCAEILLAVKEKTGGFDVRAYFGG